MANYDTVFSADINNQLNKVIPFNPLTGTRDNIITKYEISLTDSERHNLESFLEVQQANSPHGQLSDDDLVSLCPSRYISSICDVKDVAKAMRTIVTELDKSNLHAAAANATAVPAAAASDSVSSSPND